MNPQILLIDDDDSLRRVTEYNLSSAGFSVRTAASGREGLSQFKQNQPDLVVTDVKLGDLNGLDLLAQIKATAPEIPVIVITAFGSIEMAVEAMRQGAFTFLTKPFDRETLRLSCRKAIELRELSARNQQLTEEIDRLTGTTSMITASSIMTELLDVAIRAAASEATILISGESGTGKEVLARLIHRNSPRHQGPMVAINCAAIPESLIESELFGHVRGAFTGAQAGRKGRFQSANGGTLFLDEIGELKPEMQAKLLRAIQERVIEAVGSDQQETIDIRLIAATNRDLQAAMVTGEFREDLYYRLSVIPLHLPPLRERREDIPALISHFLKQIKAPAQVRFSDEALVSLREHSWPGNIRELQNLVERAVILRRGEIINSDELGLCPSSSSSTSFLPELPDNGISLEQVEEELIAKALNKSQGNRSQAARLLQIPRHVLIYRMEKYGINPP